MGMTSDAADEVVKAWQRAKREVEAARESMASDERRLEAARLRLPDLEEKEREAWEKVEALRGGG
jgi:hypothetical protein